jgi:Ca-activated chloride channel family protein
LAKASSGSKAAVESFKFLMVLLLIIALASPVIDKFGIVKKIVREFLSQRKTDKVALSLFADFAYVAIPLTYDKESVIRLLDKLQVGVAGVRQTALYEAMFLSSNIFKESRSKHKIAILLTDGIDNSGSIPLNVAIQTIQKYGIKVYTIGIGSPNDYDGAVLHEIAQKSGGKFFEAHSVEKLQAIYKTIDSLEKSEIKADKYVKKSYYFYYPLGFAAVLMLGLLVMRSKQQ